MGLYIDDRMPAVVWPLSRLATLAGPEQMSSASDRRRIERNEKITTALVIIVLLAVVVGLVIWITSLFGLHR